MFHCTLQYNLLLFSIYSYLMCFGVLLACTVCLCEGIRYPGTGQSYSCKLPHGCWDLNPGLLEEQSVLLRTKPSLYPYKCNLYSISDPSRPVENLTFYPAQERNNLPHSLHSQAQHHSHAQAAASTWQCQNTLGSLVKPKLALIITTWSQFYKSLTLYRQNSA